MNSAPNSHKSVYIKSINIYQWIFSLFGLTLPPPLLEGTQRRKLHVSLLLIYLLYCSCLAIVAIRTCHIHHVFIIQTSITFQLDVLTKLLSYTQNILLVTVLIMMEMKTFLKRNDLRKIMNIIIDLEYNLTLQCGRHCFKESCVIWKLLSISGLSLIFLVGILIPLNYFLTADTVSIEYRVGFLFLMAAMEIKCIEYGLYIQLIYEFLACIWQTLVQLIEDIENIIAATSQSSVQPLVQHLMKNQLILNHVLLLISHLQAYFAYSLFMIFFYNAEGVLNIINTAYFIHLRQRVDIIMYFRLLYILILLLSLFIICWLTQRCIRKYNSIGSLLHNINLSSDDRVIIMRLREYSMQMMHQRLVFTCNGYMDIDFKSYGKLLLVISSYVIILVQFKMEDVNNAPLNPAQHILGNNV